MRSGCQEVTRNYMRVLANNSALWAALRAHVAAGKPLLAECGGMMSLFEVVDKDGITHRWVDSGGQGGHAAALGRTRNTVRRPAGRAPFWPYGSLLAM